MKNTLLCTSILMVMLASTAFAAEKTGKSDEAAEPTASAVGLSENAPSPLVAGGLSLIAPGAGQIYNQEWTVGGVMLAAEIGLYTVAFAYAGAFSQGEEFSFRNRDTAMVLLSMAIGLHAYSVFDAVTEAVRVNRNVDKFTFNINPFGTGECTVAYRWSW